MKIKFFTTMALTAALFLSACGGNKDADLQKAVSDKLAAEKITGVTVAAKDGAVTLSGEVADITVKNNAEKAVKSVAGVSSLDAVNLKTKAVPTPVPPPADPMLKGKTEENLKKAGCTGVTIDVKDGTVTASGTVAEAKYVECVQIIQQSGLGKMDNKIVKGK